MLKKILQVVGAFSLLVVMLAGDLALAWGGGTVVYSVFNGGTITGSLNASNGANSSGSTTANAWSSNVTATGSVDNFWDWNAVVSNASDFHTRWCAGGSCAMTYGQTNGSASAPQLDFAGGAFEVAVASAIGKLTGTSSSSGANMLIQSGANASGETGVALGTTVNLSGSTLDTDLIGACHNAGATCPWKVDGAGHMKISGAVPSSYTSGTCTSETGTGDDTHGTVTATCTAQTWIVTFNRAYATAPACTVTPMNAAASAGAASFVYTVATSGITATVTPATTTGIWAFTCIQ